MYVSYPEEEMDIVFLFVYILFSTSLIVLLR